MNLLTYSLTLLLLSSSLDTSPLSSLNSNPPSTSTSTTSSSDEHDTTPPRTSQQPPIEEAEDCTDSNLCAFNASLVNEEMISNYKDAITKDILHRLGMEDMPAMDEGGVSEEERKQISELYQRSMKETQKTTSTGVLFNDDQYSVSQFNSFVDNGTRPLNTRARLSQARTSSPIHPGPRNKKQVYFPVNVYDMSADSDGIVVKSATLKLYKAHVKPELMESSDLIDRSVLIEVYQVIVDNGSMFNASIPPFKRSLDSRRVSLEAPGWEDFDVSKAVLSWLKEPESNFGLEIVCDERYAMDSVVGFVVWEEGSLVGWNEASKDATSKYPLLNVITQENRQETRSKRSLGENDHETDPNSLHEVVTGPDDCEFGDGEERCCRFPLYISFADVGWDSWVFEPKGYQAYYCSGHCPRGYKSANKYALVLSYLSGQKTSPPHNYNLQLKCVASEFKPLNIAHLNRRKIPIVSILQNMIPQRCHCL